MNIIGHFRGPGLVESGIIRQQDPEILLVLTGTLM
jgi:hypothetical protein